MCECLYATYSQYIHAENTFLCHHFNIHLSDQACIFLFLSALVNDTLKFWHRMRTTEQSWPLIGWPLIEIMTNMGFSAKRVKCNTLWVYVSALVKSHILSRNSQVKSIGKGKKYVWFVANFEVYPWCKNKIGGGSRAEKPFMYLQDIYANFIIPQCFQQHRAIQMYFWTREALMVSGRRHLGSELNCPWLLKSGQKDSLLPSC